jgi:hypothetical protein
MTTLQETFPAEVQRFTEQQGIESYLTLALSLIDEHFPDAQGVKADYVEDPDSSDAWIALTTTVADSVSDVMDRYDHLTGEWIARAPWPERDRIAFALGWSAQ